MSKPVVSMCRESRNEAITLKQQLEHAQQGAKKLEKALAKHREKANDKETKWQTLKDELADKTKAVRQQEQQVTKLEQELAEHQERITELRDAISQRDDKLATLIQENKDRYESLNTKFQQLHKAYLALEREYQNICQKAADTIRERDELEQSVRELEEHIETLEQARRWRELPLDTETLENSLIIDYEALGDEPKQRLIALLDLYEAVLHQQPHQMLEERTNWPTLPNEAKDFHGILLLGFEALLLDALKLPLKQYLRTHSFSKEELLRSLASRIESPRLVGTPDG